MGDPCIVAAAGAAAGARAAGTSSIPTSVSRSPYVKNLVILLSPVLDLLLELLVSSCCIASYLK